MALLQVWEGGWGGSGSTLGMDGGTGADVYAALFPKKKKKMDEMIFLFPLFFLSYKAHEKCSFFFSFQILNVKTQLKPDSTAFYRNTQPSVTLGS